MSDAPTPPADNKDEFGDGNAAENWAKVRDKGNLLKDQGMAFWGQWNLQQRMMAGGAAVAALFTLFPWYWVTNKLGKKESTDSSPLLWTWHEWVGLGFGVLVIAILVSPKVRATVAGFIPSEFRVWTYALVAALGFILSPLIFMIRVPTTSSDYGSTSYSLWFWIAAVAWLCSVGGAVWKALLDQGIVKTASLPTPSGDA